MSCHGVLQLGSEGVNVSLIQLRDFDLHEFEFPFIVQHQLFNFSLQFVVVGSDISESFFFIFFQQPVNFQDSSDLLFFGFDNFFETVDLIGVELFKITLTV